MINRKIDRYFLIFNLDLLRILLRLEKNSVLTLMYLLNYENGFINWNDSNISYIPKEIFELEDERCLCYLGCKEILIKNTELSNGVNELVKYNILKIHKDNLIFNEKLIKFGWYDSKKFFKKYLFISFEEDVIIKFYQLPLASIRLLFRCLLDMDFADYDKQIIRFTNEYKKIMCEELGYAIATVNQSISNLCRINILIKRENTKYIVNPEIVFKGSILDRGNLIEYCNNLKKEIFLSKLINCFEENFLEELLEYAKCKLLNDLSYIREVDLCYLIKDIIKHYLSYLIKDININNIDALTKEVRKNNLNVLIKNITKNDIDYLIKDIKINCIDALRKILQKNDEEIEDEEIEFEFEN